MCVCMCTFVFYYYYYYYYYYKCQNYNAAITQLWRHFTNLYVKLLHSSMQTSADHQLYDRRKS